MDKAKEEDSTELKKMREALIKKLIEIIAKEIQIEKKIMIL